MKKRNLMINLIMGSIVITLLLIPMTINKFFLLDKGGSSNQIDFVIGVSQSNLSDPWHINMNRDISREAEKHENIRVIYTNAVNNSDKQKKDIGRLISYNIDLLIVSLNDTTALTPVISEVYKNIPVIVIDRGVVGYDYSLFIGPDNLAIGRKVGKSIIDLMGDEKVNIVEVMGPEEAIPVIERSKGLELEIHDKENIEITDRIIANWKRDDAEDLIMKYDLIEKGINIIFAHNDDMAYGVSRALDKRGINDIKVIGVDGLDSKYGGISLVEEGRLHATFTCPTGGREAVQYAIDILNQKKGIPKKIILRSKEINRDKFEGDIGLNSDGGKKSLGFIQVGSESQWRIANSESIINAAEELEIKLIFKNVDENNTLSKRQKQEKQIEVMREFIKEGVDVIALSPIVEDGWEEVFQEAIDAGIPVILSDREVSAEDKHWTCFIGSDFIEEGRRAARWLIKEFENQDDKIIKILEIRGTDGAAPTNGRHDGFMEVINQHSKFRVIHSFSGDFMMENGQRLVDEYYKNSNEEVDVIYAHNDDMVLGAIKALENRGIMPGKEVILLSVDGTRNALEAIKNGKLNCSVECNPLLGEQLMKIFKDLCDGKEIPLKIITEEGVFTRENVLKNIKKRKY